jgi:chorismate mutase
MNTKKLNTERIKIDQIDRSIFNLIKKRTTLVKYMLSLKQLKNQIVDHKRINLILTNIKKRSLQHNIDPKITTRIWKSIIWSYVNYQRRNFRKK